MASEQISGTGRGRREIITPHPEMRLPSKEDLDLRRHVEGWLIGLRVNRYSWWVHWRELADYELPRRYKWLVTPNEMARGSPINTHILDNTGTIAARNLAAGMMTGCCDPTKRWFRLRIGKMDSTKSGPIAVWLDQCESILERIFQESNFYVAMATVFMDLVVFGTAVMIIYEDFENVINCFNPCLGEYYVDNDGEYKPVIFFREFTQTIEQCVDMFGIENVSPSIARLYKEGASSRTRELVVAHAIIPNNDPDRYGIPRHFKYLECYWEWMGTAAPQGGAAYSPGLLRKQGYYEAPHVIVRWDLVSNDAYGRSPGMDALPDVKQLQLETKRKAQGIDKQVAPPLMADIQLKNQPASLLPNGITYISGMMATGNAGMKSVYGDGWKGPQLDHMVADLEEVRGRIKETFYNNLFQTISQYETRSNVTAVEIDARRSESMIMLGPVFERVVLELLQKAAERTWAIASRAGVFPPAPVEIQGKDLQFQFISMLELAQDAAQIGGIERMFQMVGQLEGVKPDAIDVLDTDYGLEKVNYLLHNDPKLVRDPQALAALRAQRAQAAQAEQQANSADAAQKLAQGAQTMSQTPLGGGQNALQAITGG